MAAAAPAIEVPAPRDSLAAKIGKQTGSELVFYHIPQGGRPEISVSSPKLGDKTTLRSAIDSSFKVQPAAIAQRDTTAMMLPLGGRQEILIGGAHYVGERVAALSASGNEVGGFIALGARGVIAKPFDPMVLARQVRDFLGA